MFLSILESSCHELRMTHCLTFMTPSPRGWEAFPTPGALTHTRIIWAFSPSVPQFPGVTPGSPLCPWCFRHSLWRGAWQVDCNPLANVIVSPSFYVASMKDLAKDNEYLRLNLWPTLEGLYMCHDVGSFWSIFFSRIEAGISGLKQFSRNMVSHRPCTPIADLTLQKWGGEGNCELVVHIWHCLLTFNSLHD
jgi:hypothetical protein